MADTLSLGKWFEAAGDRVEENTVYFNGGGLKIGVEYRRPGPEDFAHLKGVKGNPDEGLSLHVLGDSDDFEYLRFDHFRKYPHYHYMTPGKGQVHFVYDEVANGEMLAWSLQRLRIALVPMLELAGMHDAASIDMAQVSDVIDRVESYARQVMQGAD